MLRLGEQALRGGRHGPGPGIVVRRDLGRAAAGREPAGPYGDRPRPAVRRRWHYGHPGRRRRGWRARVLVLAEFREPALGCNGRARIWWLLEERPVRLLHFQRRGRRYRRGCLCDGALHALARRQGGCGEVYERLGGVAGRGPGDRYPNRRAAPRPHRRLSRYVLERSRGPTSDDSGLRSGNLRGPLVQGLEERRDAGGGRADAFPRCDECAGARPLQKHRAP
mmetsp:Transcript_14143/g.49781  ORF Transcript_14143/g.49781 Transcript_14143/m.49781 type:complete len:223 (+) Transcript_14143:289-957(+)